MSGIFAQLRRRHVFRVVGIYAVVGWVLMQLANHFEDSLNLPGWIDTFVTIGVLIGFPIAVILAWIYDLTGGLPLPLVGNQNQQSGEDRLND